MSVKSEMLKKMFLERAYIAIDDFDFDENVAGTNIELIEQIRKAVVANSE